MFILGKCGGSISTKNGVLTSPFYPSSYQSDRDCVYTISIRGGGTYIELNILTFELENPSFDGTVYDYLEIRDGSSEDSQVIGMYSGTSIPKSIHSSQSNMWIR